MRLLRGGLGIRALREGLGMRLLKEGLGMRLLREGLATQSTPPTWQLYSHTHLQLLHAKLKCS